MKKQLSFIIYNYCYFTIEIIDKLIEYKNINFKCLIYLMINFITNVFILAISENVPLEKIKMHLDTGCHIIIDYIIIGNEEHINDDIKYNNAIQFAYQKILNSLAISGKTPIKNINKTKLLINLVNAIRLIQEIFNVTLLFIIGIENTDTPYMLLSRVDIIDFHNRISQYNKGTDDVTIATIDNIHNLLIEELYSNFEIIETFLFSIMPGVISAIKDPIFKPEIYNLTFGYISNIFASPNINTFDLPYIDIALFFTIVTIIYDKNKHKSLIINNYINSLLNGLNCTEIYKILGDGSTMRYIFTDTIYKKVTKHLINQVVV